MFLQLRLWLVLGTLASAQTACTTEVVTTVPSEAEQEPAADDDDDSDDDAAPVGEEVHGIPEGQMPPPGGCRIWDPDLSPGRQEPPGDCDELRRRLPPGFWLLYRPNAEPRVFRIA